MINNQMIKGEYFFEITMYTMFGTYAITTSNHNLITNDGINFFLNKCTSVPTIAHDEASDEYKIVDGFGYIGYIGVGTSIEQPKLTDTSLKNLTIMFTDVSIDVVDNELVMVVETDGSSLSGTSEIGVYSTNNILISRDVHTTYTLPSTSSVKLTYKFTLNQTNKSEEDYKEEEYDD